MAKQACLAEVCLDSLREGGAAQSGGDRSSLHGEASAIRDGAGWAKVQCQQEHFALDLRGWPARRQRRAGVPLLTWALGEPGAQNSLQPAARAAAVAARGGPGAAGLGAQGQQAGQTIGRVLLGQGDQLLSNGLVCG